MKKDKLLQAVKQAILQQAIQGKLTADWRKQNPDTEPASELLKRIKAEKEKLIKEKKIRKEKPLPPITNEEIPFKLPDGWVWTKLGDTCSKTGSGSTPKGGKTAYKESGVKFIRSQNVYDNGLMLNGVAFITQATHKKMNGTKVQAKDLLLNITGGSIGRCCIVPKDFDTGNINQHVAIIRPVILKNGDFLHKIICSPYFQNMIFKVQTGAGREGLPKNKMDNILIPLPPLVEQKAIVEKVEKLMQQAEAISQGAHFKDFEIVDSEIFQLLKEYYYIKNMLDEITIQKESITQLKQSLLQEAIQGKLTEDWRKQNPDSEPASELLKHIKAEKEKLIKEKKIRKEKLLPPITKEEIPFELPDGWVWCRLGEIYQSTSGGTPTRGNHEYWNGDIYWYKSGELNDGILQNPSKEFITEKGLKESSATLFPKGTLLIAMYGATAGKLAILNVEATTNQAVCGFYRNDKVSTKYLFNYLLANRSKMIKESWGMSQPNISQTYLRNFVFALPPLAEQKAIVEKVENLMQKVSAMEEEINKSEQNAQMLMQAVLKEAFEGKKEEVEV